MFFLTACKQRLPVLGDSGCSGSCISTEFLEKNPSLRKTFKAKEGTGVAINGSDVCSVGTVRLDFELEGYPMSIKCKVIKDLMDPIILGWDWMSRYEVCMDAGKGVVRFGKNRTAPLIEREKPPEGAYYRAAEDITLPPMSKVHVGVELATSWDPPFRVSASVVTEPFKHHSGYCAARTCSRLEGRMFMTELLNPLDVSIKIPAGEFLGCVEFKDEDSCRQDFFRTEFTFSYGWDEHPTPDLIPPEGQSVPDEGYFGLRDDELPPGAKPLKLDLSEISKDAIPYRDQLRELLEVKHEKVFSKHDRDYGRTHLIQYRAHMKDPDQNPIATLHSE